MDFNYDTGTIFDGIQYIDPTVLAPLNSAPAGVLQIVGTAALGLPSGSTAQEPSPAIAGWFRYNSDNLALEYFNGTVWVTLSNATGAVSSFHTTLTGLTPSSPTTGAVTLAGTLGVASGGTGATSFTENGVLFGNSSSTTGTVQSTSAGTQYQVLNAGASGVPTFDIVHLDQSAAVGSSILGLSNGGTNFANTGSDGSIMYNNGTAIVNSTVGTLGQVLTSSGAGSPTWTSTSSTLTTSGTILISGAGGTFTANGATFVGSGTYSGVTLDGTPTAATDAVTKAYADGLVNGLSWKQAVQAGTTTDLGSVTYNNGAGTLTDNQEIITGVNGNTGIFTAGDTITQVSSGATATVVVTNANATPLVVNNIVGGPPDAVGVWTDVTNPGATFIPSATPAYVPLAIDGYTVLSNNRVLIKNESNQTYNGIYYLSTLGTSLVPWVLTRTLDANTGAELAGAAVFVEEGTVNATTSWVQQTFPPITLGTSNIVWVQFSGQGTYSAGSGLLLTGNTFSVKTDGVTTYINASSQVAVDSSNTADQVLLSAGSAGTTATWGAVPLGNSNAVSGTLLATNGGTGYASYTIGDTLYADTTTSLAKLPIGSAGQILTVVSGIPSWTTISTEAVTTFSTGTTGLLANGVNTPVNGAVTLSGTLGVSNGGTGATATPTNGQILIGNGTSFTVATLGTSTGISTTTGSGSLTINNTGVTSNVAGTGISVSGATGAVTISNTGVLSVSLNDNSTTPIYTTSPSTALTGAVAETITLNTQAPNTVFAGPATGVTNIQPTFRTLVYKDVVGSGKALQLYSENPSSPTVPTTTGTNTVAIGTGAAASGTNTFALGNGSSSSQYGGFVQASGDFGSAGQAQHGTFVLRNQTVGNTQAELWLDGSATAYTVPTNSVVVFSIFVSARRTDVTGGQAGFKIEGVIYKDTTNASTAFRGTPSTTILGRTSGNYTVSVTADTSGGTLQILVNGPPGSNVNWVATLMTTEVTN